MTQNIPEDSDKKEAASFFKKWMKTYNESSEGGNWDEVCLQWCKQKDAARKDNADPNCKMYCFRRPVSDLKEEQSWNPLSGYKIVVVDGVEECATHLKDMNVLKEENPDSTYEFLPSKLPKYELDLGNVWSEAKGEAKIILDEKVKPLYHSSIEQAYEWKKSPEAQQLKSYVQEQVDKLYTRVFQTSPPSNADTPNTKNKD